MRTVAGPGRGLGTGLRRVGTRVGTSFLSRVLSRVLSLVGSLRRAGLQPRVRSRGGRRVVRGGGSLGPCRRRFGQGCLAWRGGGRRRGGAGLGLSGRGLGRGFASSRWRGARFFRGGCGLRGGRGSAGRGDAGGIQWKLRRRLGCWMSRLLFGSRDFGARGWRAGGRVAGPTRG